MTTTLARADHTLPPSIKLRDPSVASVRSLSSQHDTYNAVGCVCKIKFPKAHSNAAPVRTAARPGARPRICLRFLRSKIGLEVAPTSNRTSDVHRRSSDKDCGDCCTPAVSSSPLPLPLLLGNRFGLLYVSRIPISLADLGWRATRSLTQDC